MPTRGLYPELATKGEIYRFADRAGRLDKGYQFEHLSPDIWIADQPQYRAGLHPAPRRQCGGPVATALIAHVRFAPLKNDQSTRGPRREFLVLCLWNG